MPRVSNLIGKELSCQESRCRIEAGLTRYNIYTYLIGKVAIGKAKYLLNIVFLTPGCSNHLFSDYFKTLTLNYKYIIK